MNDPEIRIMSVQQARRALTDGDIRSEVMFQNDVNRLLASLEDLWTSAPKKPPPPPPR